MLKEKDVAVLMSSAMSMCQISTPTRGYVVDKSLFYVIVCAHALSRISNFHSVQLLNRAVAGAPATPTLHSLKSWPFMYLFSAHAYTECINTHSWRIPNSQLLFLRAAWAMLSDYFTCRRAMEADCAETH